MASSVLIAGIGNVFLGDDGFGVEVVHRVGTRNMSDGVTVLDVGIRGVDLTFALLDEHALVILVDAERRGDPPGTVRIVEPNGEDWTRSLTDPHGMAPLRAIAMAKDLGAKWGRLRLVSCEPESFGEEGEGRLGLSPAVEASVGEAVDAVEHLVREFRACTSSA